VTTEIRQGDCLGLADGLRSLPDASVDAVVTDPPYCSGGASESGRGRASGQGLRSETIKSGRFSWFAADNMTTGGLIWLLRECASEWLRILKPGGSAVVFCDWRMAPMLAPALESTGLRYQNLLVWDKGSMGLGRGFRMQHELALHLTSGVGAYHDKSVGNVIKCGRPGVIREHPTQKPVDLIASIVRVVSPLGGLVADPFAGSGTTAVACAQLGRRFIGWERDPAYCAVTRKRADAAMPAPDTEAA
jgi:DNA modification methylase